MLPSVTVTNPVAQLVTAWDEFPAWIEAVNTVEIKARVAGYLEEVHFEDGAEVEAGSLLFSLDGRPFEADLARATGERQRAEAACAHAQSELTRAQELRGTAAISDEEFERRASAVRELAGAQAAAQAAELQARLNREYARIRAPIAGKLGRRQVALGDLIPAGGDQPLVSLVSLDPVYAYCDVDEHTFQSYLGTNRLGGLLGAPCELALAGSSTYAHAGKIDFYDNQVARQTGTIRVRGVFANPGRALIPGQFVRLRLQASAPQTRLMIPEIALVSDLGRKLVYVVSATNTVEPRPVTVGRKLGTSVVITDGLTEADRVVVLGLFLLRPGMPVQLSDGQAPPAGASGGEAGPAGSAPAPASGGEADRTGAGL
ncbi:MAG: efflux RND transporter periplasmic adaptor subunit [Verrucomicrobia bacterium]|nr:efflux RND transporter periplasmic adaptor subunit [Verrucomicrobiota bacterium]